MKTEIIKINSEYPEFDKIVAASKVIRQGGLVVFPTETVYGIAANFNNERTMARLREVKRRPEDKPFSIHIAQKGLISNYTPVKDPIVYKLIDACWPGPLTVIVPSHEAGKTIGIRMPQNKIAIQLVQEARCTVAAPSANFSGNPPPSTCEEALKDLNGLVDLAIDGGPAKFGQASSVVDFTQGSPKVVRLGAITQEEVDRITQKKTVLFVCTGNSCRSVMAEYLLRDMLKGRQDIEVFSAGTGVFLQTSASTETVSVLQRRGIDASGHRSQSLNHILLHKADLILVMTRNHRQQVLEWAPEVESRVYQLREFCDDAESRGLSPDIPDPIGQSAEAYEDCRSIIESSLKRLIKLI